MPLSLSVRLQPGVRRRRFVASWFGQSARNQRNTRLATQLCLCAPFSCLCADPGVIGRGLRPFMDNAAYPWRVACSMPPSGWGPRRLRVTLGSFSFPLYLSLSLCFFLSLTNWRGTRFYLLCLKCQRENIVSYHCLFQGMQEGFTCRVAFRMLCDLVQLVIVFVMIP